MRVLFVTERYPPHEIGGYEVACHTIAEGMLGRGHEVTVLTSDRGLKCGAIEGHVHRMLHQPEAATSLRSLGAWEFSDLAYLRKIIASKRPQVIYSWSILHLFPSLHRAFKTSEVPTVYNIQDAWIPAHLQLARQQRALWEQPSGMARKLLRSGLQSSYRGLDRDWQSCRGPDDLDLSTVVFASDYRRRQHAELGLPCGQGVVIHNAVDTARFIDAGNGSSRGRLRLLFAGRLVFEKGPHTAIQALKHLSERSPGGAELTILGPTCYPEDYAGYLKELVSDLGLKDLVRFAPPVANSRMHEMYREHDVLIFPSIGPEGLPVTLLEAMAVGLTVVSTATGGSAEILRHNENSLVFAADDACGLADCLADLLAQRGLRRRLAEAARSLVTRQFGLDTVLGETEAFLQACAGVGRSGV